MKAVGLFTTQISMALYCTILLKVYLDVFLVRENKGTSIVGIFSYKGGYWKRCIFPIAFIVVWMLLEGSVQLFYMFLFGSEAPFEVISVLSKVLLAPFVLVVRSVIRRNGGGHIPYAGSPYMLVTML